MIEYKFLARSPNGKKIRGNIKLENDDNLENIMINHNYKLIKYKKITNKKRNLSSKKIIKNDLLSLCENLYLMIKAGISLKDALKLCADSTSKISLKKVIENIVKEMEKGKPLSFILCNYEDYFPLHFRTMIQLSEVSGNLKVVLEHLISYYKFEIKLKKKIMTALFYPMLLLVLSITIVIVVSIIIIPTFITVFNQMNVELPIITKIIISMSNFISDYFLLLIIAIISFVIMMIFYFKTPKGTFLFDKLKVSIPIVKNINLLIIASKFCRCLKILIGCGISTINSLQTTSNLIGNAYVKEKFNFAIDEVKRGVDISSAIYTLNLFPIILVETLKISEKSGSLDYSLQVLADLFEEEEQNKLQKLTSFIEPIFILLIAGFVVLLVVAIFVPLFSMLDNIGGF